MELREWVIPKADFEYFHKVTYRSGDLQKKLKTKYQCVTRGKSDSAMKKGWLPWDVKGTVREDGEIWSDLPLGPDAGRSEPFRMDSPVQLLRL